MASEKLVISDAGLARSRDFKNLAQVLPRLPPEMNLSASSCYILNTSHSSRNIVKKFDIT
jgi:hypothetical protein